MTKTLKIGIDLDDTFWDLVVAWIRWYNRLANDDLKPTAIRTWDIERYVKDGCSKLLYDILEQPEFWDTVMPKPGSTHIMQELLHNGHELYLVTATSCQTAHMKMRRFFKLCPFMKDEMVIIAQKKQLINVDVLIDDNPNNLIGGNYRKLLFDAPHNWNHDENLIGAKRCHDWVGVYEEIKNMTMTKGERDWKHKNG